MKCEKCGATPNPGDQVCMNCGANLSFENAIVPTIPLYVIGVILGVLLIIFLTVIITIAIIK